MRIKNKKFYFFIFYSHLKMASERSKRRDLLACIFITKSISKKLLIKMLKTNSLKYLSIALFTLENKSPNFY